MTKRRYGVKGVVASASKRPATARRREKRRNNEDEDAILKARHEKAVEREVKKHEAQERKKAAAAAAAAAGAGAAGTAGTAGTAGGAGVVTGVVTGVRVRAVAMPRAVKSKGDHNDDFRIDSAEYGGSDSPVFFDGHEDIWKRHGMAPVHWYIAAMAMGEPLVSLTDPIQPELPCDCEKTTKKITLYMMSGHVDKVITHCDCTSFVEVLFKMQFIPSGGFMPNAAVHLAVLKFCYVLKMVNQVSNHGFAEALSFMNVKDKPLTRGVLNNAYNIYRKVVNHSTGMMNKQFTTKHINCYACEGAETKVITLDGNFQMKRMKLDSDSNAETNVLDGIFQPSDLETALWGTKSEVTKYERSGVEPKDCILDGVVDDNNFRAASDTGRKQDDRYADNGIFSMSCARHGVPERLYDIHGGEGFKYALACVAHAISQNNNNNNFKLNVMYDIACRCNQRIQQEFPMLKGNSLYAVTAFHAYAHTVNCQVNYHPRYISGFGNTDGEGCERFWSYLNRFVSITRSMKAPNRRITILDAVNYDTEKKMLELPRKIQKKYNSVKSDIEQLEKKITTDKLLQLSEGWNTIVKNLSIPHSQRYINKLKETTESQIEIADIRYQYFMDAAKYLAVPTISHPLLKQVKEYLEERLASYDLLPANSNYQNALPPTFEDARFRAIQDVVNDEVATFLNGILESYVSMLIVLEEKTQKERLGTVKAAKIFNSLDQTKKAANAVHAQLIKHINDHIRGRERILKFLPRNVNHLVKVRKNEIKTGATTTFDNELLDFHKLNRAKEEIIILQDESDRLIKNIKIEEKNLKTQIENLEKNRLDGLNSGYLFLLHQKLQKNLKMKNQTKKYVSSIATEEFDEEEQAVLVEDEEMVEKVPDVEENGVAEVEEVVEENEEVEEEDEEVDKDEEEDMFKEEGVVENDKEVEVDTIN